MSSTNDSKHVMICIYAEAVAKQALLAHYMDADAKKYHHDEMIENLRRLLVQLERTGIIAELSNKEAA